MQNIIVQGIHTYKEHCNSAMNITAFYSLKDHTQLEHYLQKN